MPVSAGQQLYILTRPSGLRPGLTEPSWFCDPDGHNLKLTNLDLGCHALRARRRRGPAGPETDFELQVSNTRGHDARANTSDLDRNSRWT